MTAFRLSIGAFVLPGLILYMAVPGAGEARSLDKEDCEKLATERLELASRGVEMAIVKGPAWTKANKPEQMLQSVRRYLEVEEKLRFRCPGARLPDLEPEEVDRPDTPPQEPVMAPRAKRKKKTSAVRPEAPDAPEAPTKPETSVRGPGPPLPGSPAAKADDVAITASTKPAPATTEAEEKKEPAAAADPPPTSVVDEATARPDAMPFPAAAVPMPDRRPNRVGRVAPAKRNPPKKKKTEATDLQLYRPGP